MKRLLVITTLVFFYSGFVFATAGPTRATVILTGNPSTDFASDEYMGSRAGLEVWITWNSSTLWVAWKGGSTNKPTDKYFVAVDINPGTSNGTTNIYGGMQWTGTSQNGLNKPDFAYHWENTTVPLEQLGTGDAATGWTTTNVDFVDFIVAGAPGIVEIGIPWSSFGSSYPASFSFWVWIVNNPENDVWSAFPTDIPINTAPAIANSRYYVPNTSIDVSPNTLTSIPLPVELSSFTYQLINNNVQLNWITQTEVNNYGFEIQRKVSSRQLPVDIWEVITFVEGHGNSNSPKYYSFVDDGVSNGKYFYRLKQIDNDGSFEYSDSIEVNISEIPGEFILEQNYPNPFNPSTVISVSIPVTSVLRLEVYNMLGEKVTTLFSGTLEPGKYRYHFNAKGFSSGVYFYKLTADKFISLKKMLLIR